MTRDRARTVELTTPAAAARLGRYAAARGLPVTSCLYSPAGDPAARACAGAFVRAYLRRRPQVAATIDHDGDPQP